MQLPIAIGLLPWTSTPSGKRSSTREDWNKITCWGHGCGPSYRYGMGSERTRDGGIETEVRAHANIAVLIDDVDISIAWGYDPDESLSSDRGPELDFSDFLPSLPDKTVHRMYADVFYSGSLVDRELLVVADGGRYYVPIPTTRYPKQKSLTDFSEPEHHYSRWDIGFAEVVQSFEHADSLHSLLQRMTYVLDDNGPIAGEGK
jgi:hypothetical protein